NSETVVKLRRASDNAEKDFTASELTGSVAGDELVTNGDFATDSDWDKDACWSISGGQAVSDGTVAYGKIYQDIISADAGIFYKMTFTVSGVSNYTSVGFNLGSNIRLFSLQTAGITSEGTYTAIFKTIGGGTKFGFYTSPSHTLTLDNLSCKEYTPTAAELWTLNGRDEVARPAKESAYVATLYDQA
ncbi:MAG: hypothetical protein GY886_10900, partial [Gammaproteobacteria bacterium]|nr:hypothetical protein [Gammaproteobacteria bacterium]